MRGVMSVAAGPMSRADDGRGASCPKTHGEWPIRPFRGVSGRRTVRFAASVWPRRVSPVATRSHPGVNRSEGKGYGNE